MLDYFSWEKGKFTDEYKIHTVLRIAKVLHDKIDALNDPDETKYISKQICKVIHKIDYGRDLQKTLKTYTEAWGMFSNLDEITETLLHATLMLAIWANKIVRAKHNKKTLAFVKACIAYAHITIPSLHSNENPENKITLFIHTAWVALMNGLISETDSIIHALLLILNA